MALNLAATMRLDNRGFAGPLQESRGQLAGFTRSLRGMAGPLAGVAAGVFSIRMAMGQVRQTFSVIAGFGDAMAKVGAVSGATGAELEQLTRIARELGATTMFSAQEAAEGLTFLAMAGFSARESIEAIPQVLNLAAAGGLELGTAADIATNIMSAFGISASGLGDVVDDLATVSASANTNVEQLGHGMSFAGPLASAFGISLQEVLASLGVLGDVGMGNRAGRQLQSMMRSLTNETAGTREALQEMGLTMADIDPAANSLRDVLEKLASAGMTPAQASAMFGEAAAGVLALTGNIGKLDELTASMAENEGAAKRMAEAMADSLAGDVRVAKSAIEELRLTLGDLGATDFFRGIVQSFGNLVVRITEGLRIIQTAMAEGRIGELFGAALKLGAAEGVNALVRGLQAAISGMMKSFELLPRRLMATFDLLTDGSFWLGIVKVAAGAFQGLGAVLLTIFAKPLNYLQAVMDTVVQQLMKGLSHVPGLGIGEVETKSIEENLADREAEGGTWLSQLAQEGREMSVALMREGAAQVAAAGKPYVDEMQDQAQQILEAMVSEWEGAPDMIETGKLREKFGEIVAGLREEMIAQAAEAEAASESAAAGGNRGTGTGTDGIGGGLSAIVTDRLARIGGFVGGGGGPALDYARRTADATRRMNTQLDDLIQQGHRTGAAAWG